MGPVLGFGPVRFLHPEETRSMKSPTVHMQPWLVTAIRH